MTQEEFLHILHTVQTNVQNWEGDMAVILTQLDGPEAQAQVQLIIKEMQALIQSLP